MIARALRLPGLRWLTTGGAGTTTSEIASINRRLFNLAWPSLVENLLQQTLGVVDLMMVGRLGANAIAGVGLANQMMMLMVTAFMGFAVGNTALVARSIGAGDRAEAERIAKQSLTLGTVVSLLIAGVGYFYSHDLINALAAGKAPEAVALGGDFLQVITVGAIVGMVMVIGGGTLRGAGDTRTPMVITGLINVINIFLAYSLIFGHFGLPALGVVGSALATTIARGIGAIGILYVLFKRGSVIKLSWQGKWGLQRDVMSRLLNIGIPAALEQIVFGVGFMLFSLLAIGLGAAALAAQQVAFNVAGFSILPAFAFGVAATTLVGQNLGARDPRRAELSASQALKSALVWMVSMGVVFLLFGRPLVSLYTPDPEVIRLGTMCMTFIAFGQPFQAAAIVLASALRGAGDTRTTTVITFIGIWLMRIGIGWIFGYGLALGLFGLWIGWAADFVARASLVAWRYRAGKWQTIRV